MRSDNNAMNRSRENLPDAISADWHSPIISATIYLRVARRGSINADVITLKLWQPNKTRQNRSQL